MKERLMPDSANPNGTNNNSIPIHKMPDFAAALTYYRRVLEENSVPPTDIERVTGEIQSNITRKRGNDFINLVNGITRAKKPNTF